MKTLVELFKYFLSFFKSGESRTQKAKRNVAWAAIIKGGQMLIELVKVPIMLTYLDQEKYGVWLTIVSIVVWIETFDLGLGAGLRYKLSEAIAKNDKYYGKKLVSTAYISLSILMIIIGLILLPLVLSLDWTDILNVSSLSSSELTLSVLSVLLVFIAQFVLALISTVLQANMKAAISEIFKPLGSVLSLVCILLLGLFSSNSLLLASLAMSVPYLVVLIAGSVYFFSKEYRYYIPSINYFDKKCIKDIYSLGVKFFIGNLSTLVVFTSSNFLLSNFINPVEVSVYNTARTYFGLMTVLINLTMNTFVVSVTDAYIREDYEWVRRAMKKLNLLSVLIVAVGFVMLTISPVVVRLWTNGKITIPLGLSISLFIYYALNTFIMPYSQFAGAVGKLSVSTIASVIKIFLYIPIAVVLIKSNGSIGLVVAQILISTMLNYIVGITQYHLVITQKAKGIWNK